MADVLIELLQLIGALMAIGIAGAAVVAYLWVWPIERTEQNWIR